MSSPCLPTNQARHGATVICPKKEAAKLNRDALVALIGELYALHESNRAFLNARFSSADSALARYKKTIHDALFPNVMLSAPTVRFRDAKKAISDYRKASGDPAGLAELYVYAVECGTEFTCKYGDMEESFYESLIRLYASAVKAVFALDLSSSDPFISRLQEVIYKAGSVGWGYGEEIESLFNEGSPP